MICIKMGDTFEELVREVWKWKWVQHSIVDEIERVGEKEERDVHV